MYVSDDHQDALLHSMDVQTSASSEGFDWPDVGGVLDKVDEEVREIREALAAGDTAQARKELGDLLLVSVNLARFLRADPRGELLEATRRFSNRYQHLMRALEREGKTAGLCSADELEARWQRVKPEADEALRNGA